MAATNRIKPERKLPNNSVTADMLVWSVLSLIALLGGIGILFFAFGRWNFLGWHGREHKTLTFRAPGEVALTPAQRVTAWFFFVMAVLFLIQTLVGGASQHYRADISNFFGIDLAVSCRLIWRELGIFNWRFSRSLHPILLPAFF